MKIVYASDQYWPRISGMAVSIDAFKSELEKQGHNVYIFSPEYPGSKEIDALMNNKRVFRFKSFSLFFSHEDKLVYPHERNKVFNILDYIKPDIIHIQTEFTMGQLVWEYALINKKPLIMTAHTNWEELMHLYIPFVPEKIARAYVRYRLQRIYNLANFVIVPTSLMKDLMHRYNVKTPIEIIPTGVVKSDFASVNKQKDKKNSEWYKIYPSLKGKKILLSAGRIGKEKNLTFLVDVFQRLMDKYPDLMLVFVGDGPFRNELEWIVKKRNLWDRVVFTGFVVRSRMKEFFSIADIFVFASKVESQGLVTIESMICKTPVVAIGEQGTKEVMNGDNGGFMVNDDINEFADKVHLLLSDHKLYKKKAKEAFEYAQHWTIESNAAKMLAIYKKYTDN